MAAGGTVRMGSGVEGRGGEAGAEKLEWEVVATLFCLGPPIVHVTSLADY